MRRLLFLGALFLCTLAHSGGALKIKEVMPKSVGFELVVTKAEDSDDGICNSDCSLREAISAASSGDLITFSSFFLTRQTIFLNGTSLTVNENITISGPGSRNLQISGVHSSRIFNIEYGFIVNISGMTILHGRAPGFGGGILNLGITTLSDLIISENEAATTEGLGSGGGVFNGGALTLINSEITKNSIFNFGDGGGIYSVGDLTIIGSNISGNSLLNFGTGGGISANSALTVINSSITGNSTIIGSAGISSSGMLIIKGSTISGNISRIGQGAAGITSNNANIVNCTVTNNSAQQSSSASGVFGNGVIKIRNSIVAGNLNNNTQPDIMMGSGFLISEGFNLIGDPGSLLFNATADQVGTSNLPIDPELSPLALNGGITPTHVPRASSPGLDQGNSSLSEIDQRGRPRIFDIATTIPPAGGDNSDIGAVEAQAVIVSTANDAGIGSLRLAIAAPGNYNDILFDPSYFNVPRTIHLTSGTLSLEKNTNIIGPRANILKISAGNLSRVFNIINYSNANLSGLTIMNGNSGSEGGGGIRISNGRLSLNDASLIENNSELAGGAVLVENGLLELNHSSLSANSTRGQGGAIYLLSSSALINNSTIANNSANISGGVVVGASSVSIFQTTIANNHSTVSAGGGLYLVGNTSRASLKNCILANNSLPNLGIEAQTPFARIASLGFNLTSDKGAFFANQETDKINIDPQLGALADNGGSTFTVALLPTSPAIDSGAMFSASVIDASIALGGNDSTDQRGRSRIFDLPVPDALNSDGTDIGAYEAQDVSVSAHILQNGFE
jgi:large repetitive protein